MAKKPLIRKLHALDATDQILGRLASSVAKILMGKNKTSYEPHLDAGDIVEIKNIDKLAFKGRKLEQKVYYRHSRYPGGLKTNKLADLFTKNPEKLFRMTVMKMLPKNGLRDERIKRLRFISK